jgi:hypothetical protein
MHLHSEPTSSSNLGKSIMRRRHLANDEASAASSSILELELD